MSLQEELLKIEKGFWERSYDADYYREFMADNGLAVFGEPVGVMSKKQAVNSTSEGSPGHWTDIRLQEPHAVQLSNDAAALVYKGMAKRGGEPYSAYCSSVYVKEGGAWKLALHQQSAPTQVPATARM